MTSAVALTAMAHAVASQAAWGFLCLLPVFAVNGVRYVVGYCGPHVSCSVTRSVVVAQLRRSHLLRRPARYAASRLHALSACSHSHVSGMAGWAVFTFGFAVEWLADHQKSQFNQGGAAKNKWIQHGLWR